MPRARKTPAEKRAEVFLRNYNIGKARTGFQEPDIARALGISQSSLYRRKVSPDKFTFGQVLTLNRLFGWTADELSSIIGT